MEPERQRAVAAWSVVLGGFLGCGLLGVLIEEFEALDALGAYALVTGFAVAAGVLPMPASGRDWHPFAD
jgi:O-antigen/teichoic acid export membrane protein